MHVPRRWLVILAVLGTALSMAVTAGAASAAPAGTQRLAAPVHEASASRSYNGLALTPPMGWNDWYQYRCGVTQADVLANAEALVTSGLSRLGYDYVNLDDCWMATTRAADGQLQADPTTFPNGIAWLAAQLHAMGLKLGVYESFGTTTCQGRPGSYGHYQQDADTFASWGVDFLKFDYCGVPAGTTSASLESDYQQMSRDLLKTGRHIVFSQELPIAAGDANPSNANYIPYVAYSSKIANMWRVAPDLTTNFDSTVFGHLAADLPLDTYAHPGAWNDLDMLLTGASGYDWTVQQQETQMSIWAEMASPLIVSTDLTSMTASTEQILGNKAVIAVDQDRLGRQGHLVASQNGVDIVAKPLADGDVAVLLANTASTPQQVSTTAVAAGLRRAGAYSVSDLWADTTRETAGTITETVPGQSATLLRVAPLYGPAVSRYAPLTNVTASVNAPAYAGSQFDVAQPGQAVPVDATFLSDGSEPLADVSLSLSGPSGWSTGSPISIGKLSPGQEADGTFDVTVPPGTAAGTYTLTVTANYRWGAGHSGSDTTDTTVQVAVPPSGSPTLDGLPLLSSELDFGHIGINENYYGTPLSIHGVVYPNGLWVNSVATLYYYLGGNCSNFSVSLGLDDSDKGTGAVVYEIYADGTQVYSSGVVTNTTPTVNASVSVSGAQVLELYVGEGNGTINYGNADFGDPQLTCNSTS